MKKGALILLIGICIMEIVSASYECSVGGISEDQKELNLYKVKSINGLGIGLVYSDETAALNKYSVKMIIDAGSFELTESENSTNVEMLSDTSMMTLIDINNSKVRIRVDDNIESVEEGDIQEINGLQVFVYEFSGTYPNGTANVNGIIGYQVVEIDNENLEKIVEIESIEYLIGLFTASDDNAIIKIGKCVEEDAEFVKIADAVVENTTNVNKTAGENINDTTLLEDETTDNKELVATGNIGETQETKLENGLFGKIVLIATLTIIFTFVLALGIIVFRGLTKTRRMNSKREESNLEQKEV